MPTPYVGVTGIVSTQEVEAVINEFSSAGYSMTSPHIPMLGVLASFKSLNAQPTSRRYPRIELLPELMRAAAGKAFTAVHYNTSDAIYTLCGQVKKVFDGIYQGGLCRALQLNVPWPEVRQVGFIRQDMPEMQILLQLSQRAMTGLTPKETAERVKLYGGLLSYVLIDPSGGRGLEFDLQKSLEVYRELREQTPGLTIGFAGGLTGANVEERARLLTAQTETSGVCIDTESGVRDKLSDKPGDDVLNVGKVREYLQGAHRVLP
ncbi:MAG TPA: hypothetical protein VI612_02120 [Candidatus Nanoarchaeia archaeon]|nr:hypothetical protein [Candidatus Nanoarchaeia archaeon]